jgi:hypothetical protein
VFDHPCADLDQVHIAAFWLMHDMRAAIPQASPLGKAEFATIRERATTLRGRAQLLAWYMKLV